MIAFFLNQKILIVLFRGQSYPRSFTPKLFFLKAKIDSNTKHLVKCFLRIGERNISETVSKLYSSRKNSLTFPTINRLRLIVLPVL